MKSNAYGSRKYTSRGTAFGSSLRRYWPKGVGPDLPISNPTSWEFSQAQATIISKGNGFGQAQADIKATSNVFAQAQATIIKKLNASGQANADINAVNYGFGQAQADIKATSNGFGQANSDIKATSNAYGQAQGTIANRSTTYGQAQGDIKAVTYVFAQSQADIKQTYYVFGQAQGSINSNQKYAVAQAQALIVAYVFTDLLADAYTYDFTELSVTIQADLSTFTASAEDPDPVYHGEFPADGSWITAYSSTEVGWLRFTISEPSFVTISTLFLFDQIHDTVLGVYTGDSTSGSWHVVAFNDDVAEFDTYESRIEANLNTGSYILQLGFYASATPLTAPVTITVIPGPTTIAGQAQALIVRSEGYGQALATISGGVATRKFGQAKAMIRVPWRWGQAQGYVRFNGGSAQAQAYISNDKVFGQASVWVRRTERGVGQTQAHIKLFRHPLAQAQALINSIHYTFGQAQAVITNGRRHGQAQAYIAVSKQYGQAQAYIVKHWAFGQVQAYVSGRNRKFACAMATVLTTGQIANIQLTDHLNDAFTYDFTNVDYVIFSDFIGYGNDPTDADPNYSGTNPSDGTWITEFNSPNGWLIFTLTSATFLRIETYLSDDSDTVLGVYTGTSGPGNWNVVAGNDDSSEGGVQSLIQQVFPAGTYILQVGFFDYTSGQWINTRVNSDYHQNYGQAQALITRHAGWAQAKAQIKRTQRGHGLARAFIGPAVRRMAQAQALMTHDPIKRSGQAQATISKQRFTHGLARAVIVKGAGYGQAKARIHAFGQQRVGQSQARILASTRHYSFGQAQAFVRSPAFGQAQALISGGRYLVRYNNHTLPGYAQFEDYNSIESIVDDRVTYKDASFTEYIGLTNKVISLRMKVLGSTYREVKDQVQDAATMVRSGSGFKKLYIQRTDRYYEALTKSVNIDQSVTNSMRALDYEIEFEAKPWLISESTHTISGTGTISTTGRTFANGGWTPATLVVTGTNITVSGYTQTQDFTGFLSVSGAVTNLTINTEAYTATIASENANNVMKTPDYEIYVGPGETFFDIAGASSVTLTWRDRWYI